MIHAIEVVFKRYLALKRQFGSELSLCGLRCWPSFSRQMINECMVSLDERVSLEDSFSPDFVVVRRFFFRFLLGGINKINGNTPDVEN